MKYIFIGVDGGGTKTSVAASDAHHRLLYTGEFGPSNHQVVGMKGTRQVLEQCITECLRHLNARLEDIAFATFCLAGADLPDEVRALETLCADLLHRQAAFAVYNDIQAVCFAGIPAGKGGVASICGTGHNVAAIAPDGSMFTVRALGYEQGNEGGGIDIAKTALHYAFRSNEQTYKKTRLEQEIPQLFGRCGMEELLAYFRTLPHYEQSCFGSIPPLVFRLAAEKDEVAQEILRHYADSAACFISYMALRAGLHSGFAVAFGGSIYLKSDPDLFLNQVKQQVSSRFDGVSFVIPACTAAQSACRIGVREYGKGR